jgi:hypothetical protein
MYCFACPSPFSETKLQTIFFSVLQIAERLKPPTRNFKHFLELRSNSEIQITDRQIVDKMTENGYFILTAPLKG